MVVRRVLLVVIGKVRNDNSKWLRNTSGTYGKGWGKAAMLLRMLSWSTNQSGKCIVMVLEGCIEVPMCSES